MVGRPRRRSRQSAGGELERLEDRTLLSVSALFSNGVLQISATDDNGPDSIEVGADGFGNVRVEANGVPVTSLGTLAASSVEGINVNGGDGSNTIDLSGVSTTVYNNPALTINVDGGNGHDTIIGSADADDVLDGGHGNDMITAGSGANTVLGDHGHDTIDGGDGDDIISGGDGDDVVRNGDGADSINGGHGNLSLIHI